MALRPETVRTLQQEAPTVRLALGVAPGPAQAPLLALDLGSVASSGWGWAVRWDREHVASGVELFQRDETPGARMLRFRRWLRDMLGLTGASLVAYGQPALHDGPEAHNLEGVLLAEVQGRHDHVAPTRAEIKVHATGRPNATNAQLLEAARARWTRSLLTEAEAHALCILAWASDTVA